jgi:hypothetical protein
VPGVTEISQLFDPSGMVNEMPRPRGITAIVRPILNLHKT